MMNVANDDLDLGLALGYSNQCSSKRLGSNSGAGVNAASKVDMAFVVSDPLSELIWSSNDGLSLKCAEHSTDDIKTSLLRDVGPSNMVHSSLQSIKSRTTHDDRPIDEENVITSQIAIQLVDEKHLCSPTNIRLVGMAEITENHSGIPADHEIGRKTDFLQPGANEARPGMVITEPLLSKSDKEMVTDHTGRIEDIASCSKKLRSNVGLASETHTAKHYEAVDSAVPGFQSTGSIASVAKEMSRNQMKMHGSSGNLPLEKLEVTAENDLVEARDKSGSLESSPTSSRALLYLRKGKGKAISDGNANERMSKEAGNSHESAESCNSTGFLPNEKKRRIFEEESIVGSKRVKQQIQDSPDSTSLVRHNSSFMNWIENMVRGFVKLNRDGGPLALSLSHPNHGHGNHDQKVITSNKNHESAGTKMGFQTIFQSIYCLNSKVQETRMSNDNYPAGESRELRLAGRTCGANVTPAACCGENDRSCVQLFSTNNKFEKSEFRNGEGPSMEPVILSANVVTARRTSDLNFMDNRTSSSPGYGNLKNEACSLDSSRNDRNSYDAVNKTSDPQTEDKEIQKMGSGSFWISRFSSKTPSRVGNLDFFKQSTRGVFKSSTDCKRLVPHTQKCADVSLKRKSAEAREHQTEGPDCVSGKEFQNHAPSMEASSGFTRISGQNCQKSKLNHILPSQKLKSSGAMASVFARRLEALKHIDPFATKIDPTHTMTTCFFCGRSGHDLCGRSEIRGTEMKDLLKNISSYDGMKESQNLCLRCFQNDHWAVTCSLVSSSGHQQPKHDNSLNNQRGPIKVQLCICNTRQSSVLETKESLPPVTGEHTHCNEKKHQVDTDPSLKPVWNGKMISDRRCLEEVQVNAAPSSGDNESNVNRLTSLRKFGNKQTSDVPEGMFDAIKGLRLSRTNIFKLMDSHASVMHLDGFFLRLRVGKWKEGLGRTGYCVAYITGVQREESPDKSKYSVSANVEGIKCTVESHYVSNHDFLEDELVVWWCTTSRRGEKMPSVNDLKLKLEEKKMLGL